MRKKVKHICFENGKNFIFDKENTSKLTYELETFINEEIKDIDFKDLVYIQEIKSNNNIEGYLDDISSIERITSNSSNVSNLDKKNRIINLYDGYKYISEKKEINKKTLKELYNILSNGLLDEYDLENMGDFYRLRDVYIYYSDNLMVEPDMGVKASSIDYLMDKYFLYLNDKSLNNTMTDTYIKSQIAHLFFVYIHPYFDINGRTSRTSSMWYLLNNDADPYIIFNRAIENNKKNYYKAIRDAKISGDVTNFIKYMMANTKKELEKEYVFRVIKENITEKLTLTDYSSIISILSMNSLRSLKDFASMYNLKNDHKKVEDIYLEMIYPLLDKNIILKERETSSYYTGKDKNFIFSLNDKYLDLDKSKIRRIKL